MKPKINFALSSSEFKRNQTSTRPLWISIVVSAFVGINISLYYTSIYPYLKELDPSVSIEFLGWVVAAASLGQSIAGPLFGYWNQKTHSVICPVVFGFTLCIGGQLTYLLLPLFPTKYVRWIMLLARFVTGIGTGTIAVLRTYQSLASPSELKMRYMSFGTGFLVIGITSGPGIQALFSPFGENGYRFLKINWNMYSLPTLCMIFILLLSIYVMLCHFEDDTSRFVFNSSENEFQVLPKFDKFAVFICIFCWTVCCLVAIIFEVISTPLTIAMYNWNNAEAILYNGIFVFFSCLISVIFYFVFGLTRIGQWDKRKLLIAGLVMFIIYLVIDYPWFFYEGPLDFIPENTTTKEIGGCERSFEWCANTVRVPIVLYFISFIINGIGFPFICAPNASLYSEILGPRRQGTMQGIYAAAGSITQFSSPIIATALYKSTGYKYVILLQFVFTTTATVLFIFYYRYMQPLQLKPKIGKLASYKNGIFYHL